ncbi:MAG TPA: trehalose-phosphatase [Dehalococcoidia bacterium]|nr:trehalose-phosphatase [Dehalococcoidia bacterium]
MTGDEAVERAVDALLARPSIVVTDFDGTLSEIVVDPAQASLVPGAREALTSLRDAVDAVCVVSGRSLADVRRRVGVEGLVYAGNHGLEWHGLPGEADGAEGVTARLELAPLVPALQNALSGLEGVWIEDKGLTLTIHFRGAEDVAATARAVRERAAAAVGEGYRLRPGRLALEIVPEALLGKERFLQRVIAAIGARGVVALGDDVSDLEALRLVRRRAEAGIPGLAVGVASEEAPPELAEVADTLLQGPLEAADWLLRVVSRLRDEAARRAAPSA